MEFNYKTKEQQTKGSEQRSKQPLEELKVLAEDFVNNSVEYIGKNPRKVFWRGTAAIAFSFLLGYSIGMKSDVERKLTYFNSNLSSINRQNIQIMVKLEEMEKQQNELKEIVKNLESDSKARISTIENKIQFQKAVEEGEKHVEKMEKKRGWKRLLPWNWF